MTFEPLSNHLNFQSIVDTIYQREDFDFVAIAQQQEQDPHLIRWVYAAGNTNERFRKIVLRSGIGIAGLVVKTGKPFWKNQLTRYNYTDSMYTPIAKCESLTSAVAVPIVATPMHFVTGVLLAGYRGTQQVTADTTQVLSRYLNS